jgi:hypothetical protein
MQTSFHKKQLTAWVDSLGFVHGNYNSDHKVSELYLKMAMAPVCRDRTPYPVARPWIYPYGAMSLCWLVGAVACGRMEAGCSWSRWQSQDCIAPRIVARFIASSIGLSFCWMEAKVLPYSLIPLIEKECSFKEKIKRKPTTKRLSSSKHHIHRHSHSSLTETQQDQTHTSQHKRS